MLTVQNQNWSKEPIEIFQFHSGLSSKMVKTLQKINLHFPVLNLVVDIVQHFCQ